MTTISLSEPLPAHDLRAWVAALPEARTYVVELTPRGTWLSVHAVDESFETLTVGKTWVCPDRVDVEWTLTRLLGV